MVDVGPKFLEWGRDNVRPYRFSGGDRRFFHRLGSVVWQYESSRSVDEKHVLSFVKLQGVIHSSNGVENFSKTVSGKNYPNPVRQYNDGGLPKPHGGSIQRPHRPGTGDMVGVFPKQSNDSVTSFKRNSQCQGRSIVTLTNKIRMASTPTFVQNVRQGVGSTFNRSVCVVNNDSIKPIQQQVLRPTFIRSGRVGPKGLVHTQQLRKCTIPIDSRCDKSDTGTKGSSYGVGSLVASPTVVPDSKKVFHSSSDSVAKHMEFYAAHDHTYCARTITEPKVENICVEDLWQSRLMAQANWSNRAALQIRYSLAPSTLKCYNSLLDRLHGFCVTNDYAFPPNESCVISDFLCMLADGSNKPRSLLKNALAAMSCMYEALDLENLGHNKDLSRLVQALTKSGTMVPMQRSQAMPIKNFRDLFASWPGNELLSIKRLRLKAITLLSLVAMLRPSDIAPKSVVFNPETLSAHSKVMTTDDVIFNNDGSLSMFLQGIKNDTSRTGFKVDIPAHTDNSVDPVDALKVYIARTEPFRKNNELFIQLQAPYSAICAATVGKILDEAILLAGLPTSEFSAKSFRPTGATIAMEEGHNAADVMKVGRWKTQAVFFEHYVHNKTPASFTNSIIH